MTQDMYLLPRAPFSLVLALQTLSQIAKLSILSDAKPLAGSRQEKTSHGNPHADIGLDQPMAELWLAVKPHQIKELA